MKTFMMIMVGFIILLSGCGLMHNAGDEASLYMTQAYPDYKVTAIIPSGQDSDQDGYITVTVRAKSETKDITLSLACGYGFYSGCKFQGVVSN